MPPDSPTDTDLIFFPFDLFGSSGTSEGVGLLADAINEMIEDNAQEEKPTRAQAYRDRIEVREIELETIEQYQSWRADMRQLASDLLTSGHFFFWITGNHLGALPLYEEIGRQTTATDTATLVFQFDAHLDIYNLSDCTEELSHGNFLLHAHEPLPPIVSLGHRELLLPADHIAHSFRETIPAGEVHTRFEHVLQSVRKQAEAATAIVIDLDCDVFDAAYFPAIAHPQPFGLSPQQFLRLLDAVWSDKVIGVLISEFHTAHDIKDRSLSMLVWLIEYLLLRMYE